MKRSRIVLATVAAAGALAAAACSSGEVAAPPAPATTPPPLTVSSAAVHLGTAATPTLGVVVVGPDGRTLYRFDKDTTTPPTSNCYDACATAWPPVLVPGGQKPAVDGVDASLLGTVTRKDGTTQVTLAGSPLYTYAKDTAPGQTTGQDVGGVWFAVTPAGAKASAVPAPPSASAPAGGSSGY
jgi:predicted lipoprotein with Yx(FWY)xxD motif